ncbi:sulfurtransferase complex subunit TusB [Thalassovita sp.]|uniref:sulfurtransferase complex subunit TusB n=1 Tax=Thalassovita sp. TaxID=1979401 RepID=UPI0029DE8E78|nr:sulfurtransferase complex subunit TusB [Thalassovita sp.]
MSTLHTVNKSPFATNALKSCLDHCLDGDAVLMIEDGVYGGLTGTALAEQVAGRAGAVAIYVLAPDAEARGLPQDRMITGVGRVDYDGFVDLVAAHDRAQAWL